MNFDKLEQLKTMAQEVSSREGCFLYHLEVNLSGKGRRVCVYIDKETQMGTQTDTPRGASVEDCANVSRGLSLLLDVEDLIPGDEYELEVSTPGLERGLFEPWHYERVLGQNIQVKTVDAVTHPEIKNQKKGVKTIRGHLKKYSNDGVQVFSSENGQELLWEIPYNNIHKAKLLFEFDHPGVKKK